MEKQKYGISKYKLEIGKYYLKIGDMAMQKYNNLFSIYTGSPRSLRSLGMTIQRC